MATQAQAQQAQQAAAMRAQANNKFMALSYERPYPANAQNGSSYVPGRTLNFDAPVISGGYLTKVVLTVTLDVNYTPNATSPTVALNAAGIWGILSQINVKFGETQITTNPFMEHVFSLMRGFNRPDTSGVVGQQVAGIQAILYSAPTLNSGDNTWKVDIEIPLNNAHPGSINGFLPVGQTGTKAQIQVTPPTQFVGADPLENVVSTNGTVAVSGSVDVTCMIRDYKSLNTLEQLKPDFTGLATCQTIKPQELNPLTANAYQFRSLNNPYPVIRMASIIIDGQSSGTFAAAANIQGLELDAAENTSSEFYRYDDSTGGVGRYYQKTRQRYGQDLPEGVISWVDAPAENSANPSNLAGAAYLNLTSSGYPAARFGVKVGAVGESATTGITPRVVTFAQILNPKGITLV